MSKATDERDRLREMVRAMAAHGPEAMRLEFVIEKSGQCRLIATHSGGIERETMLVELFATYVKANFNISATEKPHVVDDVPKEDEAGE